MHICGPSPGGMLPPSAQVATALPGHIPSSCHLPLFPLPSSLLPTCHSPLPRQAASALCGFLGPNPSPRPNPNSSTRTRTLTHARLHPSSAASSGAARTTTARPPMRTHPPRRQSLHGSRPRSSTIVVYTSTPLRSLLPTPTALAEVHPWARWEALPRPQRLQSAGRACDAFMNRRRARASPIARGCGQRQPPRPRESERDGDPDLRRRGLDAQLGCTAGMSARRLSL